MSRVRGLVSPGIRKHILVEHHLTETTNQGLTEDDDAVLVAEVDNRALLVPRVQLDLQDKPEPGGFVSSARPKRYLSGMCMGLSMPGSPQEAQDRLG